MIFVIGGARSGKSSYAEKRIKELQTNTDEVVYIATAIPFDKDMNERVKRHQEDRPINWHTVEQYKQFNQLKMNEEFIKSKYIILDCMTVMITNLMFDHYTDIDYETIKNDQINKLELEIENEVNELIDVCDQHGKTFIIVSNEVGYGLVPSYRLGRIFRDIAGRINQKIASRAEEVVLVTAGIPLKIK
ncbi:bifunctional adenosylcobinamide kinase/adenosylcobinamide-phosphate guanylyltransferase [Bacillus sp. AFS055030]|uniref:bifunctional adenosylcobinamide kinase/adenosylcobinamide-phosphate guanylyltransferase n=1 Tax=Bacillus sp. AFS055030 TaxID=2033507 RepID=UPI000BFBBD0A|nr:bifunctional adenosylcobinamide kinase/adenosylcobinamide-phosphate guanylyltransferase [Bacillus sp. AFS055030]PGL71815.1 bifunctional adenosylcobinamide kinase/adenosylcobinamide-phosphate guanylyltransferase [Bacillus sp. AFS055030]